MPQHHEPTLADVARVAGVSVTTVSRVLNDRGYLSQETRDRVAAAIAELNYRPNQVARALHGKSTHSVGLIVPTVSLPFFGELAEHVEDALAERGYRILICNSMGKADWERDYLDLLVSHRVDGIVSGAHNENIAEYSTVRLPLVTVDRDLSPTIPNVRCDNERGGRLATQHLLDRGARRPALLTSRAGTHNLREAGYRTVLAEARIDPVILTVDFHTPEQERPERIATRLNAMPESVDSVFATDDLSAAAVLEWASTCGLHVPRDFKVIGFDGTAAVHRALPGLSTIRQPIQELAYDAVAILMEQIHAGASGQGAPCRASAPPPLDIELIEGRTT